MQKRQILVVGNDELTYNAIKKCMQNENTDICHMPSTTEALASFIKLDYSLVIMDIPMQETKELEMLRMMRVIKNTPVLAITVPLEPDQKVSLLRAGVDAYIERPLDVRVCIAQGNALIQRYLESKRELEVEQVLPFGAELLISPRYRQVFVDGKLISLTRKEFDLLYYLASHPGWVFSREMLYSHIWDVNPEIDGDNTVKTHIKKSPDKTYFGREKYIHNVWGIGYKFVQSCDEK